jgi:hypothetical protein
MIPLFLQLRVKQKNSIVFGIWFPVFLLWLILLPLLAVPAPLIFLVALILWKKGKGRLILFSYIGIFILIFNLSGLKLDIQAKDKNMVYFNLK